jgi:D-glycero-alpha-D-manno-heptose-7-phosphate kinase
MIITQTPLRISLLGGNTDFPKYFKKHGGAVLTATIDKYIYCIVKERFDDKIYINYSEKEKVGKVSEIKHDLVREAMKLVGVDKSIEITFLSDIPSEGSGLGSSSAVVIGLLNALHAFKGESVSAGQLAKEACKIEIDILKHPIGWQDQYAIAYGGFNLIEFLKNEPPFVMSVEAEDLSDSLMLFYTGKTRSADKILAKMKLNTKILDKIKEEVYKKLDHITDPVILGDLLDRYWAFKRMLNKSVSTPEIDKMYMKMLHAGALGGKIVGAGGGGFLLVATLPENKRELRALGYRELAFKFSKFGSRVIFNISE